MRTWISLLLAGMFLVLAGCEKGGGSLEQKLRGEWKEDGESFYVTFSENHVGIVDFRNKKQPFAWVVLADGRVQVTDPDRKVFYLKLTNNKLRIEGTKSVLSKLK
ncbi:hypothetical protein [Geobacter sp. AOG2]|uniref:hypothetical protein n=1 Tax=Geobacter sp. AOG2 TaxID=1566347 RepID=UPI001CC3660E|nr:hypothetical protein [Geobacter sp. AOG2]GFE62904.1 hypothetical protein AOG2_34930 [Geobacter sp. AOG2]